METLRDCDMHSSRAAAQLRRDRELVANLEKVCGRIPVHARRTYADILKANGVENCLRMLEGSALGTARGALGQVEGGVGAAGGVGGGGSNAVADEFFQKVKDKAAEMGLPVPTRERVDELVKSNGRSIDRIIDGLVM